MGMKKPIKVLNLFSGIGGNRKLWKNVSVTSVESHTEIASVYQDNFPSDKVVVGDASNYLEKHFREFDFIWSSPPCQSHSKMAIATRHKSRKIPDMTLYGHVIFLCNFFTGGWAVENVKPFYAPLIPATVTIGRHMFWTSSHVASREFENPVSFMHSDKPEQIEKIKNHLGIFYDKNVYFPGRHSPGQVLRNCVPPEVGLHVFESIIGGKQ